MQLVVLANEIQKQELKNTGGVEITWIQNENDFIHKSADGFIDLLFEDTPKRIALLKTISSKPVLVNSVITTLKKIDAPFIRINAWPGFLTRSLVEASYTDEKIKREAEEIFLLLNKRTEWIADEPGFVTPRVIAMIINEAYFTLEEKVSTKQEIDTAMKLGTSYPFGPFEWAGKIGLKNIYILLTELSKTNSRYKPADLLKKEASS